MRYLKELSQNKHEFKRNNLKKERERERENRHIRHFLVEIRLKLNKLYIQNLVNVGKKQVWPLENLILKNILEKKFQKKKRRPIT